MSNDWELSASELYRQLAQIAVPARDEQIAVLLTLIPFKPDASFKAVELASGEGYLSAAIARAFPNATLLALDYEESMREATARRLGERGTVDSFDIRSDDWFDKLDEANVVVSSLCIHHLDGSGKQRLFAAIQQRLSEHGTLLIADVIESQTIQANRVFAATWDNIAEAASLDQTHSRELFELFQREHWNLYHYPDPDFDKPSPLFDQLQWLKAAGFPIVDCFWMQAGHAIYGGYRQARSGGLDYRQALHIARKLLSANDNSAHRD